MLQGHNNTTDRTYRESDQVGGPEFSVFQFPSVVDLDSASPQFLGCRSVGDLRKRNLITAIAGAHRSDGELTIADPHDSSGVEVDKIGRIDIEPEESVESVRSSEAGDPLSCGISRGTQPRQ